MTNNSNQSRVTIKILNQMKKKSERISMLTAYDFSFAKIIDVLTYITLHIYTALNTASPLPQDYPH